MTGAAGRPERVDASASTRDHLLQAVIDIAGEQGKQGVTHRSVAARADVTHGLVRHYFGTREAMLAEALENAISTDLSEVRLATDRVEEFGDGLIDAPDDTWTRRVLQYEVVLDAIRGSGDRELALRLYERYEREIEETLRHLGIADPDGSWRLLLFAALDGLALQHGLMRDSARTAAALDHLHALLATLAERSAD